MNKKTKTIKSIVAMFVIICVTTACAKSSAISDPADITEETATDLRAAIYNYYAEYMEYPSFDRVKLLNTLNKDNPRGINFWVIPDESSNEKGEILDGWSNPFIWKISKDGQTLQLISKGPNEKLDPNEGDSDDLVFTVVDSGD